MSTYDSTPSVNGLPNLSHAEFRALITEAAGNFGCICLGQRGVYDPVIYRAIHGPHPLCPVHRPGAPRTRPEMTPVRGCHCSPDEIRQYELCERVAEGRETAAGRISVCPCNRNLRVGTMRCDQCRREQFDDMTTLTGEFAPPALKAMRPLVNVRTKKEVA